MKILLVVAEFIPILSIVILLIGIPYRLLASQKSNIWIPIYLCCLLLLELYPYFISFNNLPLLSISSYLHLIFTIQFAYRDIFQLKNGRRLAMITIAAIPVFLHLPISDSIHNYHAYVSVLYDFIIVAYILAFFLNISGQEKRPERYRLRLANFGLLFFSFDLFMSVSSNYLLNADFILIISFWLIRVTLLQLYYIAIIRYK